MNLKLQQYLEKINHILKLSYTNMINEKIKNNQFIIVSENGKIVKIPAKDIKLPE
jgi:hypothetical protein